MVNLDAVRKNRVAPLLVRRVGTAGKLNRFASRCCSAPTRTKKQAWTRTRTSIPSEFHSRTHEFDDEMDFAFGVSGAAGKSTRIVVQVHEVDTEVLVTGTLARLATWLDGHAPPTRGGRGYFAMQSPPPCLWWKRTPILWNVQHGLPAQPDNRGRRSYRGTRNRRIPSGKDHCGCS